MPPLSKGQTRKDTVQVMVESGASRAGKIAGILGGAIRDVTREIGDFASDVIEVREAAKKAEADNSDLDQDRPDPAEPDPV